MRTLPFLKYRVTPFLMRSHVGIRAESNVSLMARLVWRYRVRPSRFITTIILKSTSRHGVDLGRDVAAFCNSVTDKSGSVTAKLEDLTGLELAGRSSFFNFQSVLDKGAHGLIADHKKWCAQCYQESMTIKGESMDARVADELYWSLSASVYCDKHLGTLSSCCGSCYQKQPYISNKFEPGFCHFCGSSLANAPALKREDDEHDTYEAQSHLNKIDVFLPHSPAEGRFNINVFSKNLRGLVAMAGDNGVEVLAECFGVSPLTLNDWCSSRHGASFESLLKIVDGLQLPKMSLLFTDLDTLLRSVGPLTTQFNFNVKNNLRVRLPEISKFVNEMVLGKQVLQSRSYIAKKFGVSVGMLEHAFPRELKRISELYRFEREARRKLSAGTLDHRMDVAVQRCYSKKRTLSWPHVISELKSVDLSGISQARLDSAREKAIKKYLSSTRRDRSRSISNLTE